MSKFKITFSSGLEQTVEQSDCQTVEQLINCRFGSCDTTGIKVELLTDEPVNDAKEGNVAAAKKPTKK